MPASRASASRYAAMATRRRPSSSSCRPRSTRSGAAVSRGSIWGPTLTSAARVRSNTPSVCVITSAPSLSRISTVTGATEASRSRRQTSRGDRSTRRSSTTVAPCRTTMRAAGRSRVTSSAMRTLRRRGSRQEQDRVLRRARDAAQIAHRQPVLREPHRLLGLEEAVGLLVPEQPCLQLDIGAVVIRERRCATRAPRGRRPTTTPCARGARLAPPRARCRWPWTDGRRRRSPLVCHG